ncbi:alpha-galactosidase [Thermobrachium celere]|uniref:alpha-galactosidase n=1 Tax=Thermobrachium celere TaxID=53422 RepID=UPI001940CE92|nr:alpha-galactosidase [Thermobrachium celere]GFR34861.1 alpha-galactosidase [Thermobrachium celere]
MGVKRFNDYIGIYTKNMQYVFKIEDEFLRHVHFGDIIPLEDFSLEEIKEVSSNDSIYDVAKEEFSYHGRLRYKETCLKVEFEDGTRDLVLKFKNIILKDNQVEVYLQDDFYKLEVVLRFIIFEDEDIIARNVEVKNIGEDRVDIEKIFSFELNLEGLGFFIHNVGGHWGSEGLRFRQPINYSKVVLESRKGNTGHSNNPYFILERDATEDKGEVYFGVLEYSGNFKIVAEGMSYGHTRILAGINDFDSCITLKKGEGFKSPTVYFGYTKNGFSDMSRRLHRFIRNNIMPKNYNKNIRPVLYNSWEATLFDVKCEHQIELAKRAKELGCELFVIDDGWFGERNSDRAGLGDWYVNKEKFPKGLKPLIDEVKALGMDFGIWVEPEMVNPDSDLYRKHPEWVYQFKNRECTTSRNQLVLNMTLKEVQDYVYGFLDKLLSENDISFIKWDMNRPFSEAGALNLENRRSIWIKHTEAVFDIVKRLREKYPNVHFEACASGGGRIDLGSIRYFDQYWTSDNTDAFDRLKIQEAYSLIYPAIAMRSWVTDCPNFLTNRTIPLKFRFHCAMMGTLGIGGDINKWTEEEKNIAKKMIEEYKSIRHIVQFGDLYRLNSIQNDEIHSVQYVLEDESVVFTFLPRQNYSKSKFRIKLKGLDSNKKYKVTTEEKVYYKSGAYLMNYGIELELKGDYSSSATHVKCE